MFYSSKTFKIFIILFLLFILSVVFNNCFSDPDHSIIERPSSSDHSSESMENLKRSIIHKLKDLVPGVDYVPDEVIVKLKEPLDEEGTSLEETSNVLGKISSNRQASLKPMDSEKKMFLYKISTNSNVSSDIATKAGENFINTIVSLNQDPRVEYAEPNYYIHIPPFSLHSESLESETSLEKEIEDSQSSASHPDEIITEEEVDPSSSSISTSTRSSYSRDPVVVAVLDTGINKDHRYFNKYSAFWENPGETRSNNQDDDENGHIDDFEGWNFAATPKNNNINDTDGHGTMVSGTVLRSVYQHFNVSSMTNLLTQPPISDQKVKIMTLKISETGRSSTYLKYLAVKYAVHKGAKIINISFAGYYPKVRTDIEYMTETCEKDILVVTASGNEKNNNDTNPAHPANLNFPNMISVAALNTSIQTFYENNESLSQNVPLLANFSNYGSQTVHIAAPGTGILVPYYSSPEDSRSTSGTSFSAPIVAGLAAEVLYHHPDLSPHQLREVIFLSSIYKENLAAKLITGKHISFQNIHGPPSIHISSSTDTASSTDTSSSIQASSFNPSLLSIVEEAKRRTPSKPECQLANPSDNNPGGYVWQPPPPVEREPPPVEREPPPVEREPPPVEREPPPVEREPPPDEEELDVPIEIGRGDKIEEVITSEVNDRKFGGCLSINSLDSKSKKKKPDSLLKNLFSILFVVMMANLPFFTYFILYRRAKKMTPSPLMNVF